MKTDKQNEKEYKQINNIIEKSFQEVRKNINSKKTVTDKKGRQRPTTNSLYYL